jgi:hypothetical protein
MLRRLYLAVDALDWGIDLDILALIHVWILLRVSNLVAQHLGHGLHDRMADYGIAEAD